MSTTIESTSTIDPSSASDASALFDDLPSDMTLNIDQDYNIDDVDWVFWDQLIKDYQAQEGQ